MTEVVSQNELTGLRLRVIRYQITELWPDYPNDLHWNEYLLELSRRLGVHIPDEGVAETCKYLIPLLDVAKQARRGGRPVETPHQKKLAPLPPPMYREATQRDLVWTFYVPCALMIAGMMALALFRKSL